MISSGRFARLIFIYFAAAICTSARHTAWFRQAQNRYSDGAGSGQTAMTYTHISSRGTTNYSAMRVLVSPIPM